MNPPGRETMGEGETVRKTERKIHTDAENATEPAVFLHAENLRAVVTDPWEQSGAGLQLMGRWQQGIFPLCLHKLPKHCVIKPDCALP